MVGAPANGWVDSFQKGLDAMEDPEPTATGSGTCCYRYGKQVWSAAGALDDLKSTQQTGPGGALGVTISAFLRLGARTTRSLSLRLSPQASISICCCVPGKRNMNLISH